MPLREGRAVAGAENPVCLPCLAPPLQGHPQSCLKTAGPLPTLTACSPLHSTYVPVPSKIKVKKNQVSGGWGPRPLSSGLFVRLCRMTERRPGPAGTPAAGRRHQPREGSHLGSYRAEPWKGRPPGRQCPEARLGAEAFTLHQPQPLAQAVPRGCMRLPAQAHPLRPGKPPALCSGQLWVLGPRHT